MRELEYAVVLHPDPEVGGYSVTVPALPGVVTEGDTTEEAIAMACNEKPPSLPPSQRLTQPLTL